MTSSCAHERDLEIPTLGLPWEGREGEGTPAIAAVPWRRRRRCSHRLVAPPPPLQLPSRPKARHPTAASIDVAGSYGSRRRASCRHAALLRPQSIDAQGSSPTRGAVFAASAAVATDRLPLNRRSNHHHRI